MKEKKLLKRLISYLLIFTLSTTVVFNFSIITEASTSQATKKKTGAGTKKGSSTGKKTGSKKSKTTNKKTTSTKRKQNSVNKKTTKKATVYSGTATAAPKEVVQNDELTLLVNSAVNDWMPANLNPGGLRVNSVVPNKTTKTAKISLNENFTYLPVTSQFIKDLRKHVVSILPDSLSNYDVSFTVGDKGYSYYITTIDKLPEKYRKNTPFVIEADPVVKPSKGMYGDIIAMWASHGRYFKPGTGQWFWQRPQLFQVTEDTHTMGYIYPYVVPMIENAGGYVLLPRERDINTNEVIVDNDTNPDGEIYSQPYYKEVTGSKKWKFGDYEGFIYDIPDFHDTENPFENGTYRETTTITGGKQSLAAWYADIPEDGEYAVYVSYKTLPNSTEDALYTVNYSGGSKQFKVNQKMGGGTWIYLGTFPLEEGYSDEEPIVVLSNLSSKEGRVLTADAIKIGGGMGNISRSDSRKDVFIENYSDYTIDPEDLEGYDDEEIEQILSAQQSASNGYIPHFSTSGMPRFLEGARYWLHWAGFPESVYSPYHGTDDYKDDYTSRGLWVNYLAGGSRVLPGKEGLNIPVDVSMALHSDAGKRDDDSFIGTLGIYYTNNGDNYVDGTPRSNSRTLTDMLMRQITMDVRQTWEPNWKRRSMWDKSYVEARVPEVPTSLIEFMSHQNFADMKYAIDPSFRFTVGRAIYKAIGRFIAERKDRKFVVQPLPVKDFAIEKEKKNTYKLSWKPTEDKLEETAMPEKYIIYERTGDQLGFHKIGETSSTSYTIKVNDDFIHSYKVIAANDGGLSFPSEILALKDSKNNDTPVLIINGFDRISAPANFATPTRAGFNTEEDFGVPYIQDISFIGYQTEFNRSAGDSFGMSGSNYATQVIAGNTFDYPYSHGVAISATGKGFVSTSAGAVENGTVNLNDYKIVDLILGKQKATIVGNGYSGVKFHAFPEKFQQKITKFIENGGDLIVSGAYVASDLYGDYSTYNNFAENILGIALGSGGKSLTGRIIAKGSGLPSGINGQSFRYSNTLNKDYYIVENPDIILPSPSTNSKTFLTFSDTGESAGVLTTKGKSKIIVMSVPFESIEIDQQPVLMKGIMDFIDN